MIDATLGIVVFAAVILTQLVLGVISEWRGRDLSRRFTLELLSSNTIVELIAGYSRVFHPINVKVNARIWQPAQAVQDTLYINRGLVHSRDLYHTLYTILQILLLREENKLLRRYRLIQLVGYAVEVAAVILAWQVDSDWLILAIFIGLGLIVSSFIFFVLLGELMIEALDIAYVLIDMSDYERSVAVALAKVMREESFKYGFTPIQRSVRFVLPRRKMR